MLRSSTSPLPLFLLGVALALAAGCNPAGSKYEEADAFVAEGKYDEAIAAYEQVSAEWPDSPEAQSVPKAVEKTLVSKITAGAEADDVDGALEAHAALLKARGSNGPDDADKPLVVLASQRNGADDFDAVGQIYRVLVKAHGGEIIDDDFKKEGGFALTEAVAYSIRKDMEDDRSFEVMLGIAGSSHASDALKKAATSWICGRTDKIPGLAGCSAASPTIDGEEDLIAARARLSLVDGQCSNAEKFKGICGDDLNGRIDAAVGGPVVQLRDAVAKKEKAWVGEFEVEAARAFVEEAAKAGGRCSRASSSLRSAERKSEKLQVQEAAGWTSEAQMSYMKKELEQAKSKQVEAKQAGQRAFTKLDAELGLMPWSTATTQSLRAALSSEMKECE